MSSAGIIEPVFEVLNEAGARYVLVGGLAIVLHGHARLTADIDLAIDLHEAEALKVAQALASIGLVPRAEVELLDLASAEKRQAWRDEHGALVLSLWDPGNAMRSIDVFLENPVPFQELWARSEVKALRHTFVRVASIEDLIALKRLAGRPHDLQDIQALEEIRRRLRGT
jgi:hypothetical protein